MKKTLLSVLVLTASMSARATDSLTLTFNRTGTDASSVTVTTDLAGVSASLTSVSHQLKAFGSETLCADANGNSSPTIVYTFSISGLPDGWTANTLGLDITGYNSAGKTQESADGIKRHFNVNVEANNKSIASWTDLDPAKGISGARKVWKTNLNPDFAPQSAVTLSITVTKGSENSGCFFGLNSICLSTADASLSGFYTIKWKNNTQSYMTAIPDGSIQVGGYGVTNRIFWEFIPTEKDNCYYIRNSANGMYIGSCNMQPASASRVQLSVEPVEYYVHLSAATSGENNGCYWLSSTDCSNYDKETSNARCLNKDGASSYVITWQSGVNNTGSYWTLTESEDLYEVRPFSTEITYFILSPERKAYTYAGQWETFSQVLADAQWRFSGAGNSEGGYQIINATTGTPINDGAKYKVIANGSGFSFIDANGDYLMLGGVDTFTFEALRTSFAKNNRIFQMPCGAIGDTWIASLSTGEFHYPMATAENGSLVEGTVTAKPSKYVILTRDAITAAPGSTIDLAIKLNKTPTDNYTLTAYADFDRDGIFEYALPLTAAQQTSAAIVVPEDAKIGDCRLRLRLNSSSFPGPDDEVFGEVLDLKLNIANPSAELINPIVKANDPQRGDVEWSSNVARATAKGNALFLCWNEGMRVVSAQPDYDVEPSNKPRVLTAVFSANTDILDGIEPIILNSVDSNAQILFNGSELKVEGTEAIGLIVFNVNGRVAAQGASSSLNIAALPGGVYIAKAITKSGIVTSKIVK